MRERWGVQVLDADEDLALLELSQRALFNFEDLSNETSRTSQPEVDKGERKERKERRTSSVMAEEGLLATIHVFAEVGRLEEEGMVSE